VRIDGHVLAAELEALLAAATALREQVRIDDEFGRTAGAVYTLRRLFARLPIPRMLIFTIWRWTFALLGRRADRREMWAETTAASLALSKYRFIAFLEQRAPRLGHACFLGLRLLRLPVALLVAAALAGYVRLSLLRLERRSKTIGVAFGG
jgi:hypothetical protein